MSSHACKANAAITSLQVLHIIFNSSYLIASISFFLLAEDQYFDEKEINALLRVMRGLSTEYQYHLPSYVTTLKDTGLITTLFLFFI